MYLWLPQPSQSWSFSGVLDSTVIFIWVLVVLGPVNHSDTIQSERDTGQEPHAVLGFQSRQGSWVTLEMWRASGWTVDHKLYPRSVAKACSGRLFQCEIPECHCRSRVDHVPSTVLYDVGTGCPLRLLAQSVVASFH